jgi:hypothetical protein
MNTGFQEISRCARTPDIFVSGPLEVPSAELRLKPILGALSAAVELNMQKQTLNVSTSTWVTGASLKRNT